MHIQALTVLSVVTFVMLVWGALEWVQKRRFTPAVRARWLVAFCMGMVALWLRSH